MCRRIESAIITGPTGAIGHALCELLLSEGIIVYGITHPGSIRTDAIPAGVKKIYCDISRLGSLKSLINERVDVFFHLAWSGTAGSARNEMNLQLQNVQYTLDACRVAASFGCTVFIGAGSQAEYGRHRTTLKPDTSCFPENGYGMAKLCAGQMTRLECEKLGIDHIWPRILSVYGPHDGENAMIPSVIRKLLRGEKPSLTGGEQTWDYLYSEDAAEALLELAVSGRHGAIYPLGSGISKPLREYIKTIRDAIDPSLPLGFGEILYEKKQVMHLEADISALKSDTGFSPNTDFQTGIKRTIEWAKSHE